MYKKAMKKVKQNVGLEEAQIYWISWKEFKFCLIDKYFSEENLQCKYWWKI
jgi:hypothetical protein